MKPIELYFLHPEWQRLGLSLLHFLWQGALVLALVVGVRRLLRLKPGSAAYGLYLAGFVAMSLCPLATWMLLDGKGVGVTGVEWLAPGVVAADLAQPGVSLANNDAEAAAPTLAASEIEWSWARLAPWMLLVWLAGVALSSLRLLAGFAAVIRIRRDAEPLPKEFCALADGVCRQLGMEGFRRIFVSRRASQPLAAGFLRPMVLLPIGVLTQSSPEAVRAVLAHELAHLRRLDLWVNLYQRVVESLLFFHPAVWILSRLIRSEREYCCDEAAVCGTGDRLGYAEMLETMYRRQVSNGEQVLAVGLGARRRGRVLARVRNVLRPQRGERSHRGWAPGPVGTALCAVALVAVLAGPVIAQAVADAADKESLVGMWRGEDAFAKLAQDGSVEIYGKGGAESGRYSVSGNVLTFTRADGKQESASFRLDGDTLVVDDKTLRRVTAIDPKKLLGTWVGAEAVVTLQKDGVVFAGKAKRDEGRWRAEGDRVWFDGKEKENLHWNVKGNELRISDGNKGLVFRRVDDRKGDSLAGKWGGIHGMLRFGEDGEFEVQVAERVEQHRYQVIGDVVLVESEDGERKAVQVVEDRDGAMFFDGKRMHRGFEFHATDEAGDAAPAPAAPLNDAPRTNVEASRSHASRLAPQAELTKPPVPAVTVRTLVETKDSRTVPVAPDLVAKSRGPIGTWVRNGHAIYLLEDGSLRVARGSKRPELSNGQFSTAGKVLVLQVGGHAEDFEYSIGDGRLELKPGTGGAPQVFESAESVDAGDLDKQRLLAYLKLKPLVSDANADTPHMGSFKAVNALLEKFQEERVALGRAMTTGINHPETRAKQRALEMLLRHAREELSLDRGENPEMRDRLSRRIEFYGDSLERDFERLREEAEKQREDGAEETRKPSIESF